MGGMTWLVFALLTVGAWGLYGVLLHAGQVAMVDPVNGRYKAFLFVGLAYFLFAVLAPLFVLIVNGASWQMPVRGMTWSLLAGTAGAVGAFCVSKPLVMHPTLIWSIIHDHSDLFGVNSA